MVWRDQRFRDTRSSSRDVAAEDIKDHLQIVKARLHRPAQFGDVPAPELVRAAGQQFRLLIRRMNELIAAFASLAFLSSSGYMVRIEQ